MESELAAWASVFIATGSLIVSIISLIQSSRAQHRASAAQERIVEIEEQREQDRLAVSTRAALHPELRRTDGNAYRLYIVNDSVASARNVRVEMDGKPLVEHPAAVSNDMMPDFVGGNSEISCLLGLHMGCALPIEITVTWDDDSGQDRIYRTTLTW